MQKSIKKSEHANNVRSKRGAERRNAKKRHRLRVREKEGEGGGVAVLKPYDRRNERFIVAIHIVNTCHCALYSYQIKLIVAEEHRSATHLMHNLITSQQFKRVYANIVNWQWNTPSDFMEFLCLCLSIIVLMCDDCTQLHSINIIIIDLFYQFMMIYALVLLLQLKLVHLFAIYFWTVLPTGNVQHIARPSENVNWSKLIIYSNYMPNWLSIMHMNLRASNHFNNFSIQLHSNEHFSIIANEAIWMW